MSLRNWETFPYGFHFAEFLTLLFWWQRDAFTRKVIQQLQSEPKVYVSQCPVSNCITSNHLSRESNCNVPDISNIANYVECSSVEEGNFETTGNRQKTLKKGKRPDLLGFKGFDGVKNDKNKTAIDTTNIELELDRMFYVDDDSTIREKARTDSVATPSKQRKKCKNANTEDIRALLISLFGSPLDDIELNKSKPKKIEKIGRRHTLPVSINIPNDEFLKPLKITKKRKSENDAGCPPACKMTRNETVTATVFELPNYEFAVAPLLVKQTHISESAISTVATADLKTATVIDKPIVEEACKQEVVKEVTMAQPTGNEIIDLTADDNDTGQRQNKVNDEHETVKEENHEPSSSSEKANAPLPGLSMPLFSPVSPAAPTQFEATLPETSNATCRINVTVDQNGKIQQIQTISQSSSQRPPPPTVFRQPPPYQAPQDSVRTSILDELKQMPSQRQQFQPAVLQPSAPSRPALSNLMTPEAAKRRQSTQEQAVMTSAPQSSSRQLIQQPPPVLPASQRPGQNVHLQATVSTIMQAGKQQALQQPQFQMALQQSKQQPLPSRCPVYQRQVSNLNANQLPTANPQGPRTPQLIRILRPTQSRYEYHLISNATCGEKLFPHVYVFARWRANANRFCEESQSFLSPKDYREDNTAFFVYVNHIMGVFGKKMIKDLLTVDVENFNLSEICNVITRKLHEKSCMTNVYRVCLNLHMMIKSCEEYCVTPFTKKFFNTTKVCIERIESKSKQAFPLFTLSQLKQLESQIHLYWVIKKRTDALFNNIRASQINMRQTRQPSPAQSQLSNSQPKKLKQIDSTNTLHQTHQRTVTQTCSYQNLSDRSGRSDNLSTRPNVLVNSDNPNNNPLRKTQNVATPERVDLSSIQVPGQTSSGCGASVPSKDSRARQDTSVIQCHPTLVPVGEPRPVATDQSETNAASKNGEKRNDQDVDVIDLTWIDDGDENEMFGEVIECKTFPFKVEVEGYADSDSGSFVREVVSPADSGLGSPRSHTDSDLYKCLCGKQAIYVCACNSSMYCGTECQINDWTDHQRLCHEMKSS